MHSPNFKNSKAINYNPGHMIDPTINCFITKLPPKHPNDDWFTMKLGYMNPGGLHLANSKVWAGPPLGSYDQSVWQTIISFDFEPRNNSDIEECRILKDQSIYIIK